MAARTHTTALFAAEVQSKAEGQSVLCAKERQTRKLGGRGSNPFGRGIFQLIEIFGVAIRQTG